MMDFLSKILQVICCSGTNKGINVNLHAKNRIK